MTSGVYERTDYHRKILSQNSAFKKGNKIRKGMVSSFKGKQHSEKSKRLISEKARKMWKNESIRKRICRTNSILMKGKTGELSRAFKGRTLNSNGYWYIYSPLHPNATKTKYVLEHRLVMEKYLNRILSPNEVVHHVNEIRTDNRISNLKLFPNKGAHISFHEKFKHIPRPLKLP